MESEKDAEFVQSVSTWILKSPVMTISDGDEMKNSSNAGNSWKNVAILEEARWAVYVDENDLFVPICEFGDETFERCGLFEWIVYA